MSTTLRAKIEAERRLRELLTAEGLPQPDEVEYGHACVRFFFHESKACVIVDLEPDPAESEPAHGDSDQ